jgi:hypothetical protein
MATLGSWGRLAVGLTSLEMLKAVAEYTKRTSRPLMLIASRNQVECADLGGGYVDGLTPGRVVAQLKSCGAQNILLCRDHGGPYLRDGEGSLHPDEAMERAAASLRADVDAGFDLVHIDVHAARGDKYASLAELVETVSIAEKARSRPVYFEVGTDGNDGIPAEPQQVRADLERILRIVEPSYYVAQTGSLVRDGRQAGYFAARASAALATLLASRGIALKEHNVDYSSSSELRRRAESGIAAFNVAPEFGTTQTGVVLDLARRCGCERQSRVFADYVRKAGCWRKWADAPDVSPERAALLGGHYHYSAEPYRILVSELALRTDISGAVSAALQRRIDWYQTVLNGGLATAAGSASALGRRSAP